MPMRISTHALLRVAAATLRRACVEMRMGIVLLSKSPWTAGRLHSLALPTIARALVSPILQDRAIRRGGRRVGRRAKHENPVGVGWIESVRRLPETEPENPCEIELVWGHPLQVEVVLTQHFHERGLPPPADRPRAGGWPAPQDADAPAARVAS